MIGKKGGVLGKIAGALVAVFGLVLAVLTTAAGKSTEAFLLGSGNPTCADPKWLLQIPDDQISVNAFYVRQPDSADLTIDGSQNTAWLQWWPTTKFKGNKPKDNYIEWSFAPIRYNLRLICIADGWNQDIVAWSSTELIRRATINLKSDGCPIYKKKFNNDGFVRGSPDEWQQVKVHCKTSKVHLVVNATYNAVTPLCVPLQPSKATTDCVPLTGITEIRFYYSPDVLSAVGWNAPSKQL